jgi:hypothetical protein
MAARKSAPRLPASRAPTQRPKLREDRVEVAKPADLAALAKSFATMKAKVESAEATLDRERSERAADADTIASMLVRIVGLEKALQVAVEKDVKRRSIGPPVAPVDTEARKRVAALEARVTEAEARARVAEAHAAESEDRVRAANERLAAAIRDQESLRASLADADARARSAEDRVATRELESVRIQLEAAHYARDDAREAMLRQREAHERELDQQRERHARALKEAHDTYAEAFQETLEAERTRAREELEEERTRVIAANARIAELTDQLKAVEARAAATIADLRRELQTIAFDRDAADGQRHLTEMRLQTAEAKLELVDKLRAK